ncbi:MAG: DNA gyrase subunit A [Pseudomonadota bacterium]|nr:DNA gyrase subunit A [Pseudomonadota bacterium]
MSTQTEAPPLENNVTLKKLKLKKKKTTKQTKKAAEIYTKMEHAEHILKKPDTYLGSAEPENIKTFLHDNEGNKMIEKEIDLTPGFYKCFDELLVNAHDHKKRMQKVANDGNQHYMVNNIRVNINDDNSITFYNDGDGILVEYMEEHKMYPPTLIFGSLLSGTNFDDNEAREWGGRNGYGAKLANIFSMKFIVETVCHVNKKKFYQEFTNNMQDKTEPVITSAKIKPYTKITWYPDFKRFNMTGLNDDIKALMCKRVYDIAGVTDKDTKIYLNDSLIQVKTFEKYVDMYIGDKSETSRVFEEGVGWQVVATCSDDDIFQQVSFVNGINTSRGGTHTDYISDQIKTKLADFLKKKKKIDIKPQIIKNQLKIFVNASKIVNPVFDSQTKETLKTPKAKFGTTFDISDKFITQLVKTDIFAKIQAQAAYKDSQLLSKTDGKKSKRVRVNKLSDANKAGTPDSKKCTIIFTEGDSAKTMAISGLAEVGRDHYGVYPLRGKILNVRDAPTNQVMNCAVLNDIKQIIGLQVNTDYIKQYEKTGVWPLRYGQIMIMTDQDHDGSHIKGLMMNIFDSMWPELTKMGFITSMVTPIVKAFKGKNEKVFYTLQDYEKWRDSTNAKSWRIKYYKGLGTSSTKEAKEYFKQLKVIKYLPTEVDSETVEDESKSSEESKEDDDKTSIKSATSEKKTSTTYKSICPDLDLAFNKKRANDRKAWLLNYEKNKIPNFNKKVISTKDFVDEELIHFSNEDNDRSIPSLIDGFKPSQRKVAFGSFKRKLKTDVKVAQLAGYISEHAAYHHGEVSLENTIKNMAQDYVSANNINYLEPIGQFGSRLMGGDDAAQSRYIFTKLSSITRLVFKEEDDCLCNYLDDDGFSIEPEFYFPIFPTILANGASGIGTGFSTDIPKFNPVDICDYIKAKIYGKETPTLIPWYRGFTGTIESTSPGSFITRGKFNIINDSTVQITELPIGTWTEKYTEFLDKISVERGKETAKNFVRTFKDDSTETQVNITIKMNPLNINKWGNKFGKDGISELENRLKLTSALGITNMHMFNENGKMQKFKDIDEIIDQWFPFRASIYTKRRDYMLKKLQKELDIIKYKVAFIQEIIDDTIEIKNVKKQKIMDQLTEHKFPKISIKEDQEPSFDYLMSMDLYKLTEEEIDELKKKKEMKQLEFDELSGTSSTDLWVNDIDKFVESYNKSLIQYNRDHSAPVLSNKKKLKKPRKKKT